MTDKTDKPARKAKLEVVKTPPQASPFSEKLQPTMDKYQDLMVQRAAAQAAGDYRLILACELQLAEVVVQITSSYNRGDFWA